MNVFADTKTALTIFHYKETTSETLLLLACKISTIIIECYTEYVDSAVFQCEMKCHSLINHFGTELGISCPI